MYPWNLLATLQLLFRGKFKENSSSNVYLFSSVPYIQLFRQSLSEKVVYCSYPILPFGIVACTFFFSDNLSRNSCIRFRLWVKPVVPAGGNQMTPVVSFSAACSVGFTEPPSMLPACRRLISKRHPIPDLVFSWHRSQWWQYKKHLRNHLRSQSRCC